MSDKLAKAHPKAVAHREVDGVDMGVLEDGTPFLSARGLARLCGVAPSVIIEWGPAWSRDSTRPRDRKLTRLLDAHGCSDNVLFTRALDGASEVHAYPDRVCIAILEYYAKEGREHAENAYRRLAHRTLRDLIYSALGWDPYGRVPEHLRQLNDRMMKNTVPPGTFSVFKEMTDVLMSAAQHGLNMDCHTIPDISVGQLWSAEWKRRELSARYGERRKHPHTFPDYFPQAQAHTEAFVYPLLALGEFRIWMQDVYLPEKYPQYLNRKVKLGALTASRAELLLAAVNPRDDEPEDT